MSKPRHSPVCSCLYKLWVILSFLTGHIPSCRISYERDLHWDGWWIMRYIAGDHSNFNGSLRIMLLVTEESISCSNQSNLTQTWHRPDMEMRLSPDILPLEGGAKRLSRNVSNKLLIDSAQHSTTSKTSTALRDFIFLQFCWWIFISCGWLFIFYECIIPDTVEKTWIVNYSNGKQAKGNGQLKRFSTAREFR